MVQNTSWLSFNKCDSHVTEHSDAIPDHLFLMRVNWFDGQR